MIAIFEVFALNRNEFDFIENLEMYGSIYMEQEEENKTGQEVTEEEDLSDPKVKLLSEFKDQLTPEEYQWGKDQIAEGHKKVIMILNLYEQMKDGNDFLHSFKRIKNMANKK